MAKTGLFIKNIVFSAFKKRIFSRLYYVFLGIIWYYMAQPARYIKTPPTIENYTIKKPPVTYHHPLARTNTR